MPRPAEAEVGKPPRLGWLDALLLLAALFATLWLRSLPTAMPGVPPEQRTQLTFEDSAGRAWAYPGMFDGYHWLSMSRRVLRTGTLCGPSSSEKCREPLRVAPWGTDVMYERSPHVHGIAALHRALAWYDPHRPLEASALLLSTLLGGWVVVTVYAVGRWLGGPVSGFVASVAVGVNPVFLMRTASADNDVWNVVLPVAALALLAVAMGAEANGRRVLAALLSALLVVVQSLVWRGWTFTWLVLVVGVGAVLLSELVRVARGDDSLRLKQTTAVMAGFLAGSALGGWLVSIGPGELWRSIAGPFRMLQSIAAAAPGEPLLWTNVMSTIVELTAADLREIGDMLGGRPYFFATVLGLWLAVSASREIFYLAAVGAWAAVMFGAGREVTVAVVALPVAISAVLHRPKTAAAWARFAVGLVCAVWFVAVLWLTFSSRRSGLFLVVPAGLALGVAASRLEVWGEERSKDWAKPIVLVVAVVGFLGLGQLSVRNANAMLPRMNDAWWDSLSELSQQSETDAIVFSEWSKGYWVQYVAERATVSDGGTVATRIPYWVATAWLAEEPRQALGIFRMLACGSDSLDRSGQPRGAFGLLLASGLTHAAARDAILTTAPLNALEAADHLRGLELEEEAIAAVLRATHCQPRPAYVVVSSQLLAQTGWTLMVEPDGLSRDELAGSVIDQLLTTSSMRFASFELLGEQSSMGEEVRVWRVDWGGRGGA